MNHDLNAAVDVARAVLSFASLRDPRIPRPDNPDAPDMAKAWAMDLAGLDQQTALAAVSEHYRGSTERIMPGHIWAIVNRRPSVAPWDRPARAVLAGTPPIDPDRNSRGLDACRAAVAARRSAP